MFTILLLAKSSSLTVSLLFETQGMKSFLVIDSVDVDNSGTLNFTEFLMLMVKTEGLEGVRHVFQSYDVDNSGKITSNEFAAWMRRHGR